jgi:hypothetical protein
MKPETKSENSIKKDSEILTENLEIEDILKKPEEDNTRYGDWVKNGRTIDF